MGQHGHCQPVPDLGGTKHGCGVLMQVTGRCTQGDAGLALAAGDTVPVSTPISLQNHRLSLGWLPKKPGERLGEQEDGAGASLAPRGVPCGDIPLAWSIGQVGTRGQDRGKRPLLTFPAEILPCAAAAPATAPVWGLRPPPVGLWGPPAPQSGGSTLTCHWVPWGGDSLGQGGHMQALRQCNRGELYVGGNAMG